MITSLQKIYTDGHLELVGILYEPDAKTNKVVSHVHGMGGNFYENSFLDYIAKTLTDNGVAFFAFNNSGCEFIKDLTVVSGDKGKLIRKGTAYERFENSILDIKASVDFLESRGFNEVHLSGHSLGTPKVAFYVTETKDDRIKSIMFLSPSDMLGLVREEKKFERIISTAQRMIEENKGEEIMEEQVWDEYPISAQAYVNLFGDDSKAAIFNFYDKDDQLETLKKIKVPVFAVMGKKDGALTVSVEETMKRIKKATVSSPRTETQILGNADHGYHEYEQKLATLMSKWVLSLE